MRNALLQISTSTVAIENLMPGQLPPLKSALVALGVQVAIQLVTKLSALATTKLKSIGAKRRARKSLTHA